jgi:hypothetical protein
MMTSRPTASQSGGGQGSARASKTEVAADNTRQKVSQAGSSLLTSQVNRSITMELRRAPVECDGAMVELGLAMTELRPARAGVASGGGGEDSRRW